MRNGVSVAVLAVVLSGASSSALADEKSHRAAAEELLKVTNTEKTMEAATDQMLAVQVKANPRLEPVKDVMKKFFTKYISFAAINCTARVS